MSRLEGFYNVSIHPRALKCSWEPYDRVGRARFRSAFNTIPVRNRADGLISQKAQGRINSAIDWLLAQSTVKRIYDKKTKKHFNFRANFLTFSLASPQIHDDNLIKSKLLNTMLVHLRQKWGVKYYLWRAEAQANGNIHFHVICDKYIPWWELRHYWNKVQNNLGYVDQYTKKYINLNFNQYLSFNPINDKYSLSDRKKAYDAGCACGWTDPNSTDIHSVKHVKNLGGYIAKEVSKNSKGTMYTALRLVDKRLMPCYNPSQQIHVPAQGAKMYRSIGGNLWNLSSVLSRVKAKILVIADTVREEITAIKKAFSSKVISADWYEIIYVPVKLWASVVKGTLYDTYQDHLCELRVGQNNQKSIFA